MGKVDEEAVLTSVSGTVVRISRRSLVHRSEQCPQGLQPLLGLRWETCERSCRKLPNNRWRKSPGIPLMQSSFGRPYGVSRSYPDTPFLHEIPLVSLWGNSRSSLAIWRAWYLLVFYNCDWVPVASPIHLYFDGSFAEPLCLYSMTNLAIAMFVGSTSWFQTNSTNSKSSSASWGHFLFIDFDRYFVRVRWTQCFIVVEPVQSVVKFRSGQYIICCSCGRKRGHRGPFSFRRCGREFSCTTFK